jgi:hypothetical protein
MIRKQSKGVSCGAAFPMFAVDRDQRQPVLGPSKKLPPSITRLPNAIASVI